MRSVRTIRLLTALILSLSWSLCPAEEQQKEKGLITLLDEAEKKPVREKLALIRQYFEANGGLTDDNFAQVLAMYELQRLRIRNLQLEVIAARAKQVAAELNARILIEENKAAPGTSTTPTPPATETKTP